MAEVQVQSRISRFTLFLEHSKPILEDLKHSLYLWKRTPLALIGTLMIAGFLLVAIFAPFLATHDPLAHGEHLLPPSSEHFFGTDQYGRDIFQSCDVRSQSRSLDYLYCLGRERRDRTAHWHSFGLFRRSRRSSAHADY